MEARKKGLKYVELRAKGVFAIKPDKFKVRVVACGNKTAEAYGKVSTTDLDTAMMRYLLSCGGIVIKSCSCVLGCQCSLLECSFTSRKSGGDETSHHPLRAAAFTTQACLVGPQSHIWTKRSSQLVVRTKNRRHDPVTFTSEGEPYSVILSEILKSLCLIVKTKNLLKKLETTSFGLTPKVKQSM